MQLTISSSDYTFDASAKTITLIDPFDVVTTEQIYHIINTSTGAVIYDSDRRTHPITMTGAVITHTYDNTGMADADTLQISLDDGTSSGGSGALNNFVATVAPTTDDDSDAGYAVGSSWVDTTADKAYVCVDATVAAAVWTETTVDNPEVFLVSGTPGAGTGEVGDIAFDEDTGDIYEKESVFVNTAWDPSECSVQFALSHDDLRVTHDPTSWWGGVKSLLGVSSGKWYWEFRCIKVSSSLTSNAGIAGPLQGIEDQLGSTADSYVYKSSNGAKRNNGAEQAYSVAWKNTHYWVGVALDMDAGKIWFALNGVWQASGDPAAGTNEAFSGITGTIHAAISIYRQNDYTTANFGATAFTYPAPAGFTAGLGADTTPWIKKLAVPKSNLSASADPTTGDDSDDGYTVGSRWENITDDREFVCLDATVAAAVWLRTTGSVIPEKTPINAVAAQGLASLTGSPAWEDTFVIGGETFTWESGGESNFSIDPGTNAAEAVAKLIIVVNNSSTMTSAAAGAGTTAIITADAKGTAGNAITFTENSTNMTVNGTGTLGATATGVNGTVGEANELCADATYLYHAIAENTISDANWRRISLGSVY